VCDSITRRLACAARLVLTVVVFAPLFLALQATPAVACQCIVRTSIHHLAGADVVFTGRLTEVEGPSPLRLTYSSMDPVDYRIEVDGELKGAVPVNATVRSVVSGGSCGLEHMSVGDRYTVFAVARDGSLGAGSCGGTHVGGPDPALALVSAALLPPTPGAPPSWVIALVAIAVILGVSVGLRAWRIIRSQRRTSRRVRV
jgi:hypothetical protein